MEKAPMLIATWDDLADRIMKLMRLDPALVQRLVCAPPAAFHAYGAYLRLAGAVQNMPDAWLACHLRTRPPRHLLREVLPGGDATLWRALALAGSKVRSATDYQRIDAILRSSAKDAALQTGELTSDALDVLEVLGRLDSMVGPVHAMLNGDIHRAEAFHTALIFLRDAGVLEDDRMILRALKNIGPDGLGAFVVRRLRRIQAPLLLNLASGRLRQVPNVTELVRLGRRFRNCVGTQPHYAIALVLGTTLFFEWTGEEPAVIAIEVSPSGWHSITDLAGVENRPVHQTTRSQIEAELRLAGLKLVPVSVLAAISCLTSYRDYGDEVIDLVA